MCNMLVTSKYHCPYCNFSALGLFGTFDNGLKYTLEEEDITEEIFLPIEGVEK